jgi:hypothetical protein
MYDDAPDIEERRLGRGRRELRRVCAVAATLIAAALVLAACGGGGSSSPGVAGAGRATTTSKPAAKTSTKATALAYSKCMRSHGVANFPDPNSNGEIELNARPQNGLSMDSPQMKSAIRACRSLQPASSTAQRSQDRAQGLKFAQCMRSHGVSNFPDPPPAGSAPQSQSSQSGSAPTPGPDPNSPQFKSAMQACRNLLPSGAGSGTSVGGGS